MKPLAPNSMIQNRYLLVHLIGKGGMGEVYLAVDQRLGSAVALKRTFFADDEMLGNAFEREARTLARLRHPVLPKVSDHFAENGEQYLIMEHIAGDDLAKRLETAKKPFPLSWVLFWADQLLDALSYLHSHEPPIIHRDIKPQNLKLTDENHIVLLDFGLSKNSTGQTNLSSGSSSGSVVGYTPHYAPMEQIRGTGTNAKSDIYALSATLYQLMTNTVPADALSRADSLLNGMPDPIRPLDEVNPEVSPEISKVILKGMEVSQDKRYATAREMQKALRKAYNAMQEAMSAHTVAFNANDFGGGAEPPAGRSVPPNEAFHHEPSAASELPTRITTGASGGFPAVSNSGDSGPSVFDSAAPPVGDTGIRQADVKTEVYRAGDSPLSEAAATENYHQDISSTPATENYHQDLPAVPASPFTEDFREEVPANADTGYSPDATVPNISYGESGAGSGGLVPPSDEFFTSPNAGAADPFATVTAGSAVQDEFVQTPEPEPQPAARPIAAVPKKKGSKMPYLLGGLAALFILGIAILGAGWFVYTNYYVNASVSPSPQPTPEFSPTPEPTVENVYVPNANENSNSNTNLTVEPTPIPTPVPTQEAPEEPVQTPSTPRENPRVTRTPTTRQTGTPAVKPTPTKAKPNNRTDIIQ